MSTRGKRIWALLFGLFFLCVFLGGIVSCVEGDITAEIGGLMWLAAPIAWALLKYAFTGKES